MTRTTWPLLAAALAACAAVALAAPARPGGDLVSALGSSLGASRVVLVDALFLRAESMHRRGEIDEALDLYEAVLRLDPDDDAAAGYVIEAQLDALRALPSVDDQYRAWRGLRARVERTLRERDRPPRLLDTAARIYLLPLFADAEGLGQRLLEQVDRPRLVALDYLAEAARATDSLPKTALDRLHLRTAAYVAVEVAAHATAEGDRAAAERALAHGDDLLARRGSVLKGLAEDDASGATAAQEVTVWELLRDGLSLVRQAQGLLPSVAGAPAPETPAPGAAAAHAAFVGRLQAYAERVGQTRAVMRLQALAAARGTPLGDTEDAPR